MFWDGTAARDGELVCTPRRGRRTVRLHTNGGYVQRHSDLLAILMLVAMVFVMGLGILYLGERVHAPEQTRMIDTGPPDPPLRIE
jgi:hypothetical protein